MSQHLSDVQVGPWNQLAVLGLSSSLEHPGETNPIFLHGAEGLGKTHLLTSYVSALRNRHPAWSVLHIPGRSLAKVYQRAIYEKKIDEFRQRYRTADALVIDDIDRLTNKPGCQNELLATLDVLTSRRNPVVLSSRVPPRNLCDFLPQLSNRFLSGLTVSLSPLDDQTLRSLVFHWGQRYHPPLPQDVLRLLSDSYCGTPGGLARLLERLDGYRRGSRRAIDARVLNEALRLTETGYGKPDLQQIVDAVVAHYGLEKDALNSVRATRRTTLARRVAIYLATELTDMDRREIGQKLGKRSQATVWHARSQVKKRLEDDSAVRESIDTIRRHLGCPARMSNP